MGLIVNHGLRTKLDGSVFGQTWFEFDRRVDEGNKSRYCFGTRLHGSVGNEMCGCEDINEAIRIQKVCTGLGVTCEIDTFDEWTLIEIILPRVGE